MNIHYNCKQGINNIKQNSTYTKLLHMFGMMGVTIFFSVFFIQEWAPQWIRDNIQLVPLGQILGYGFYFAGCFYILTNRLLDKPKRNIARKNSNYFKLGGMVLDDFTTWYVDLISITIIAFTFFHVGYGSGGESAVFWSTFCSLTVFPYLGIFGHLALKSKKFEYTIPIFTNRIK